METYGDIYTAFYPLIGDSVSSSRFTTPAQVGRLCNKAVRDLGVASGCIDAVIEYDWPADQSTYAIGNTTAGNEYISTFRVEVDDEAIAPVTKTRLRERDDDWQARTGKPYLYYLDEMSATSGKYTVGLFPTPAVQYSTRWYFKTTPDADEGVTPSLSDAAYVQLPKWAVPGVLYSMLADFYRLPGARRNAKASAFYRKLYHEVKHRLTAASRSKLNKDRRYGGKHKPRLVSDDYRGDISTIS